MVVGEAQRFGWWGMTAWVLVNDDGDTVAKFAGGPGAWVLAGSDVIPGWELRAAELGRVVSLDKVRHVERCELCSGLVVFGRNGYRHVEGSRPASALHVVDDIEVDM